MSSSILCRTANCWRMTRRTLSSGSTIAASLGKPSTSSRTRASYRKMLTTPTFKPKLRSVPAEGSCPMEMPLTPMDFARRAHRLYPDREAVVDGDLRLTYVQFLERCNRWSATLQALGVRQGDRVAYIAPNTHAHLEAYYSVPQIGAVLVPIIIDCSRTTSSTSSTTVTQRSFALTLTISKPSMASGTVCLASNISWRWKVRGTAGSITNRH